MNPTPYLIFNGTCREAMTAYADILGGKIDMLMEARELPEGEVPGGVPEDKADWILHCGVRFDGGQLMGSDDVFGEAAPMAGCSVMVALESDVRARAVFDALAEGGTVQMPYAPTFWSAGFGTLTDRFGVHWMVDCAAAPEGG
jgi:PhnB protein